MLSKFSLEYFNPVHFTLYRNISTTFFILPLWLFADRNFSFEYRKEQTETMSGIKRYLLGKVPNWKDNALFMLSGLLVIPLNQVAFIFGLYYTDSFTASVFQPSSVVFTAFISIMLRFEDRSILKFVGIGLSVIGAVTMVLVAGSSQPAKEGGFQILGFNLSMEGLLGAFFFLANTFCFSAYLNVQRALLGRKIPPFTVTMFSFVYGTFFCAIVTLAFINTMDYSKTTLASWAATFSAGFIGGTIPFVVATVASSKLSPIVVATYTTTIPLFTGLLSVALGQFIVWYSIFPGALIMIGVFTVGYAKYRESKAAQAAVDVPCEPEQIAELAGTETNEQSEIDSAGPDPNIEDATIEVELLDKTVTEV
jgi:drug/metabolite transporter (DMT)-like permease